MSDPPLSKLRALSIRQPYASAIFHANPEKRKRIEHRTWSTNYRGRLFIQSSLKIDWEARSDLWPDDVFTELPVGCILGHINLVDVVEAGPKNFHWMLGSPVLLPRPVPCGGKLGMWFVPWMAAGALP